MGEEDDLGVLLPKDKLMHLKKNESVLAFPKASCTQQASGTVWYGLWCEWGEETRPKSYIISFQLQSKSYLQK